MLVTTFSIFYQAPPPLSLPFLGSSITDSHCEDNIKILCMHTNIFDVGRPAAREDNGSTGGVESLGHVGIPGLINLSRRIAPIQLQHVHPPRGECVGVLLDVVQSAGVTSTGMCAQVWIKKHVQKIWYISRKYCC